MAGRDDLDPKVLAIAQAALRDVAEMIRSTDHKALMEQYRRGNIEDITGMDWFEGMRVERIVPGTVDLEWAASGLKPIQPISQEEFRRQYEDSD